MHVHTHTYVQPHTGVNVYKSPACLLHSLCAHVLPSPPLPSPPLPSPVQVLTLFNTGYCQPPPPGCPKPTYSIMVQSWWAQCTHLTSADTLRYEENGSTMSFDWVVLTLLPLLYVECCLWEYLPYVNMLDRSGNHLCAARLILPSPSPPTPPHNSFLLLPPKESRLQGETHIQWDLSDAASSGGVHCHDLQGGEGQVSDGQPWCFPQGQLLPVQGLAGDLHQDFWQLTACVCCILYISITVLIMHGYNIILLWLFFRTVPILYIINCMYIASNYVYTIQKHSHTYVLYTF